MQYVHAALLSTYKNKIHMHPPPLLRLPLAIVLTALASLSLLAPPTSAHPVLIEEAPPARIYLGSLPACAVSHSLHRLSKFENGAED